MKLHIESVEDRIEELERDAAKLEEKESKKSMSEKFNKEELTKQLEESITKKLENKIKKDQLNLKEELEKTHLKLIASKDSLLGKSNKDL